MKLNFTIDYHLQTDGQSKRVIQVLEDMLGSCVLDYQANIQMAPFKVLYGRKCRTPLCWEELYGKWVVGPKLVCKIEEKYQVGEQVLLKVSSWKKVLRFGQKGELINDSSIFTKIDPVAYRLKLPRELEQIHDVFHEISTNPSYVVIVDEIEVQPIFTYDEEPIEIIAYEEKVLRNKRIPLVNVLS
ncbi:DNA/RNA polymerases superfamily protein [Gossypium australe]|uniref:DNA/RNA polymerases superfamily protein n=1 Tax=Gossypium australe TaxID=47621 RepID=A0A5B6X1A7_9ROSI|nr:DNA/RNA polymerases superfamily protein [Gossypium australe]